MNNGPVHLTCKTKRVQAPGFCVGFCRLFSEGPGLLLVITAGNVCGVKCAEFYGTIAAEIIARYVSMEF